jgi:hypothetical protein
LTNHVLELISKTAADADLGVEKPWLYRLPGRAAGALTGFEGEQGASKVKEATVRREQPVIYSLCRRDELS